MQSGSNIHQTVSSIQHHPVRQSHLTPVDIFSVGIAIALPVVVIMTNLGCRKYQAIVLRRQIKYLNQLWQLDASENMS
jgi:hypothetical protein